MLFTFFEGQRKPMTTQARRSRSGFADGFAKTRRILSSRVHVLAATLAFSTLAAPPNATPVPPVFLNVDRVATMNADGVRAAMIAAGWKTITKVDGGIASQKPDGSKLFVDIWRGKPVRVAAWLAPPFPEASPELFRSVLGVSATPPPPDPLGPVGTGTSFRRGDEVWLTWNHKGTTRGRIFGPVYAAEARRIGDDCVVSVQLVDHATMKKWEGE